MTTIDRLKIRVSESDENLLEELLESAKQAILNRLYPYSGETELPYRYVDLQLRIAEAMYNKIGADYEVSHTENGVSRVWGSEGIPAELLREITPMCGAVTKCEI